MFIRTLINCIVFLFTSFLLNAQAPNIDRSYEPSLENPFGLLNPNAPPQVADFAPMIGSCNCISQQRKPRWKLAGQSANDLAIQIHYEWPCGAR